MAVWLDQEAWQFSGSLNICVSYNRMTTRNREHLVSSKANGNVLSLMRALTQLKDAHELHGSTRSDLGPKLGVQLTPVLFPLVRTTTDHCRRASTCLEHVDSHGSLLLPVEVHTTLLCSGRGHLAGLFVESQGP